MTLNTTVKKHFLKLSHALLAALVMTLLFGCDSSSGGDDDTGGTLRFVNAIVGSPSLGMEIEEADQGSVSYGQATASISLISGIKPLTFYKIDIDGDTEYLDLAFDYDLQNDSETLIILHGSLDDPQYIIVDTESFDLDENFGRVGFVLLSDNSPTLDLYLTSEQEGLYESSPVASSALATFSGMVDVDQGEYEIQLTAIGEKDILYDGGVIEIEEDTNHFYLVLDYSANSDTGLLAIEISGTNAARELVADDTPTQLRFVNGIADYPSVDVYLGDTNSEPLFSNVRFGQATNYLPLEADTYNINVTPHSVPGTFLYEATIELLPGRFSSLVSAGLTQDGDINGTLILDELQNITDGVSMSFIHASSSNERIDVYLLVPGQPVFDASPLVSGLSYLLTSDQEIAAGEYELMVVQNDNEATILGPIPVEFEHGEIVDIYFLDSEGGGTPGQLEVYRF